MTRPNQITLLRIGLIPVFAAATRAYDRSLSAGRPRENFRRLAAAAFLAAAVTDGLDGYIARRFHEQSRLGTLLDPIADKGLVLVALTLLGASRWNDEIPCWFPGLVIGRDGLLGIGYWALTKVRGKVEVKPSLAGKAATVFQLMAISGVLLRVRRIKVRHLAMAAALLTALSGLGYLYDGLVARQNEGANP